MALVLQCDNYTVTLYRDSFDTSTSILTTYPTAQYKYYISYTDCCGGVSRQLRIDNQSGWDPGSDPLYTFTNLPSYGFAPFVYVQRISDGQIFIPLNYTTPDDGWQSVSKGSQAFPDCSTTTTTTTTATPTTTKNPVNVIFNSCCSNSATFSSLLTPFWGNQKVICLKDPIQAVYLISGTGSQLINSGSWSNYFLSEVTTNPGPSCSCDCATQSISCTRVRVSSTEQNVFRYLDCNSGLLKDQMLIPTTFNTNEQPTLLAIPSTCSVAINTATQTVNFMISQGTLVSGYSAGSASSITYNGPFGFLMSSTNSQYTAPVTGVYYIRSEVEASYRFAGNATNSILCKLQKDSSGSISTIDSSSLVLYYSDPDNYNGTASFSLGFQTYSLAAGDKVYVDISRNSSVIAATYTSPICVAGQNLVVFATASENSSQNVNISYDVADPITELWGPRYIMKFGHPTGQTNWSGSTYSTPSSGGYTFSWNISGSFSVSSSSNVLDFSIIVTPISSVNGLYGYQEQVFVPSGNQTFSFTETYYESTLTQGQVADLMIIFRINTIQNYTLPATLNIVYSLDDGSRFSISSEPKWATDGRNLTYFEVLYAPTYSADASIWGYDFCLRTPLQNQPPLQRISGSYTYSVCSTPGSIYYPACSPSLTFSCGSYVREFSEIGGTQCLWPTTTSTTTSSGGGGGGST
ncbi:hypothetical protein EBU71_03145 [bacterium]|nr:hypothetical protein [Candidatus Elulimicrobium humile]